MVEIEKESGHVIVVAGYGERTQWYQNLKMMQSNTIQLGKRKIQASIEMTSPEDGAARYYQRYGKITGVLFSILGYEWDGSEQGARQVAQEHQRFERLGFY